MHLFVWFSLIYKAFMLICAFPDAFGRRRTGSNLAAQAGTTRVLGRSARKVGRVACFSCHSTSRHQHGQLICKDVSEAGVLMEAITPQTGTVWSNNKETQSKEVHCIVKGKRQGNSNHPVLTVSLNMFGF